MSDTYNPNEILKLKHLNEFAAQFTAKIEGNTRKRNINPRYQQGTSGTRYTYDGSLARIPYSKLTSRTNPTAKVFNVSLDMQTIGYPSVLPVVTAENAQGISVLGGSLSFFYSNPQTTAASLINSVFVQPDSYGSVTLHYQIPAGDGFAYYEGNINVEIYDDTN